MRAVILAGGLGTRLSEETSSRPKPMIEIGSKPILWHIMKIYSFYGINDFIICCGYKGSVIREYFSDFSLLNSDITMNTKNNSIIVHKKNQENWNLTFVDTGIESNTGERIRLIKEYLNKEDNFCLTYGDGLSNVNIKELVKFHKKNKKICTITTVNPPGRFGKVVVGTNNLINSFEEKNDNNSFLINGGFMVCNKKIFNHILDKNEILETEVFKRLVKKKELISFFHKKFWYAIDTLRDKNFISKMWINNQAPWKIWKN